MLMSSSSKIEDIKSIKVQGASNVVYAAQDILLEELKNVDKIDNKYFTKLCKAIWDSRPTEPGMKNLLTNFKINLDLGYKKSDLIKFIKNERLNQKEGIAKIATDFANSLKQPTIIFTHCHSSIVENSIIQASKKGLVKYVVNSETRPLFQGRLTSKALAKENIAVIHVVDSAMFAIAKNILNNNPKENILFLTGADVITNKGDLINKIGTCQISVALNSLGIRHYVMTMSSKIDVVNKGWSLEKVEVRTPSEVWDEKNKNITIHNYSFDVTSSANISRIFTEKGNGKVQPFVIKQSANDNFKAIWNNFDK